METCYWLGKFYLVSSWGRVKSLHHRPTAYHKILKPYVDRDGYLVVGLRNHGKGKTVKIHRLVAQAFIPNPKKYPQVNHKDENKTNNHVENLEWCTNQYNLNYGSRNQKSGESLKQSMKSKELLQFSQAGKLIKIWPSMHEMSRVTGFNRSDVKQCCLGQAKQSYGYKWEFKK